MGLNRFYTPSLPQYTSQYVEEKIPWEPMIALEQQKLGRTDAAIQGAGQADALFSSLTPGYRTRDLAPGVIDDYKGKLNQWREKHGEKLYSIPALRELTSIQGEFQADPRVRTIRQDVEETDLIRSYITRPDYRAETDPNIDPETGYFRQFGVDSPFTAYQQPIFIGDQAKEIQERFGKLQPKTRDSNPYFKDVVDPKTGQGMKVMAQDTIQYRGTQDDEDFATAHSTYVDDLLEGNTQMGRYYKQLYGDEWNRDKASEIARRHEAQYVIDNQRIDTKFIPGTGQSTDDPEFPQQLTFPGTYQPVIPSSNIGGDLQDPLSRARRTGAGVRQRLFESGDGFGMEIYNKVKDDPGAILERETEIEGLEVPFGVNDIIKQSMIDQPFTTIRTWENYWEEQEANGPLDRKQERDKKRTMKLINKLKEDYAVGEPKFENDIEYNKALNAAADTPDLRLDDFDYTTQTSDDALKLRYNYERYQKDIQDKGYQPEIHGFSGDVQKEWTQMFAGIHTGNDGVINTDGGIPEHLAGAQVIDPQNPYKKIKVEDLEKKYKKGTPIIVNGRVTDETSQYGPGMFTITMGGDRYYVRGPQEIVEPEIFNYVVNTAFDPKNSGEGDFFAVRGFSQGYPEIVYNWNEEEKGHQGTDMWMNVAFDRSRHLDSPAYVLRIYEKNPTTVGDDHDYLKINGPNNEKGYTEIELTDSAGNLFTRNNPPSYDNVIATTYKAYLLHMVDAGEISEDQAIKMYQQAF